AFKWGRPRLRTTAQGRHPAGLDRFGIEVAETDEEFIEVVDWLLSRPVGEVIRTSGLPFALVGADRSGHLVRVRALDRKPPGMPGRTAIGKIIDPQRPLRSWAAPTVTWSGHETRPDVAAVWV
ncbi:MAG: hypothetical protein QOE89_3297, partial [Pseudonocardiales bacterium]|nr:hypothetical protein [Pseudonocardiales bacterium]